MALATRYDGYLKDQTTNKPNNLTRNLVLVVVNLLSLACLVWTLRDAELGQILGDLSYVNWWWIALGSGAQLSAYFIQSLRWRMILAPVAKLGFLQGVRAILTGLFASEVLPLRAGEALRCYMVSKWTTLPFSVSASSVVIERIFDGLVMWVGLRLVLQTGTLPRGFAYLSDSLGVVVLIGSALLAFALFGPKPSPPPFPLSGWRRRVAILRADLVMIGHSPQLFMALLVTIPHIAVQAVPVRVLMRAYDFGLPWGAGVALMLILRLAAALPQAPASLGLYQLLTKEFLERGYHVAPAEAARFSIVLWAIVKLPLLAAGAISLGVTGANFGELRAEAHSAAEASSRKDQA
ncbi:MAG: lysylphosphatidylglycerol synthase transmembrane domain-containing protein [Acidobacteriota bacterium]